jgi:hypothetical protein
VSIVLKLLAGAALGFWPLASAFASGAGAAAPGQEEAQSSRCFLPHG